MWRKWWRCCELWVTGAPDGDFQSFAEVLKIKAQNGAFAIKTNASPEPQNSLCWKKYDVHNGMPPRNWRTYYRNDSTRQRRRNWRRRFDENAQVVVLHCGASRRNHRRARSTAATITFRENHIRSLKLLRWVRALYVVVNTSCRCCHHSMCSLHCAVIACSFSRWR